MTIPLWSRRAFLTTSTLTLSALIPGLQAVAAGPNAVVDAAQHPLVPAIRLAQTGLTNIDANIQDYSCTFVKRERIQGQLTERENIFMKVRHKPFSAYMYFLGPDGLKGQEVLYVDGANDGKMWAIAGSGLRRRIGVVSLKPTSALAMVNQRYPITEVGIRTLTSRLIKTAQGDLKYGECEVKFIPGAKINGRVCTCIQVKHPVQRKHFRFHLARIFIDDELQIPIRYAAYQWPRKKGGTPLLDEEYTYLNVKTNNGFTDDDFDHRSEKYRFIKH